jgi:hypothetical protein
MLNGQIHDGSGLCARRYSIAVHYYVLVAAPIWSLNGLGLPAEGFEISFKIIVRHVDLPLFIDLRSGKAEKESNPIS